MAITQVTSESGESNFTVYVNIRSREMPHIRFQKRLRGIKSKAEAVRKEKRLILDLSQKVAQQEGHGLTWRMVITKWAATVACSSYIDKTYNPVTIQNYVSMLYKWTKEWLDKPATQITKGDGREVLDNIIEEGRSKAYQKKLKNTINMVYNWAIEYRAIKGILHSPVYGLKIVVKQDKRPEILKTHEIKKLLYEAKKQNHEWYYVWALALLTGMRNGELYSLRWDDVDLDGEIIKVGRSYNFKTREFKDTKAGYWRSVPLSSELRSLLLELKNTFKSEFVLPRIHFWRNGQQARYLRVFCHSIGIPEIRFHALRACFATHLIGSGVEPIKIMKICGWKDLKTLSIYLRLAGIEEKGVTEKLNFLSQNIGNNYSMGKGY